VINLLDPIQALLELEVGAQQPDGRGALLVNVTTAGAVMADLHLADHLDQQLAQILPPQHVFQQRFVARPYRPPVEALHVWIVEIRLFHTPDFVEDLVPFLARIDQHAQPAELNRLGVELFARIRDLEPVLTQPQQQFLAISAGLDVDHGGSQELLRSVLEVVAVQVGVGAMKRRNGRLRRRARLFAGEIKQRTVGGYDQMVVVAFGDGYRNKAFRQALQVDTGRFDRWPSSDLSDSMARPRASRVPIRACSSLPDLLALSLPLLPGSSSSPLLGGKG